ncbi:MAG TPA: flagellar biosynthetic protein FliR, partial [Limnochordales bacterium]
MEGLAAFGLIWVRTSTLFFAARPVFAQPGVPGLVRLGLSGIVALLLVPLVRAGAGTLLPGAGAAGPVWAAWAYAVAKEVAAGLVMAFGVNALMGAALVAGQLVDLPMGFSVVNVVDPTMGEEIPLIGQFQMLLATLIFFGVDGHHEMLRALAESLRLVPPGAGAASGRLLEGALGAFAAAFVLGVRLAAPMMGALFLADVALAVVARAVPQLNVFVVGFPAKILLGFAVLLLALPAAIRLMGDAFGPNGELWAW